MDNTEDELRVLIVEAVPADADLMDRTLRRAGLRCATTRVDSEAPFRKALEEFAPDLVLSDISLPQFNAMAALDIKLELAPTIPFIIVTASSNEQLAAAAIETGADDYLLKDRLSRLGSAVRSALDRERTRAERQRAEQQLWKSERRFRALIENSSEAIALIGKEGKILYASHSTRRTLGYPAEELTGRSVFDFMHPDNFESARNVFRKLLREPQGIATGQFRCMHGNRSWCRLEGAAENLLADPSVRAIVANYRDITEHWEAQNQLKASVREKELLLKEIHHRVKNNLQIISSLLQLGSATIKDPKAIELLRESQNRIRSMALIHEKLYRTDPLARIDFGDYLRTLATRLIRAYEVDPEVIRFRMKAGGLLLGVDTAIPCGLIVNELVTNSLKHAFGAAQNGKTREIEIDLLPEEGHRVTLLVRDNGVGLPEGAEFESFGLGLVKAMAEQLGGTISVSRGNGTEFRLSFAVPSD